MPGQHSLKRGRRRERAHQYRVIADRLQFHLERENLPEEVNALVRTAMEALSSAARLMEESASDDATHRETARRESA